MFQHTSSLLQFYFSAKNNNKTSMRYLCMHSHSIIQDPKRVVDVCVCV